MKDESSPSGQDTENNPEFLSPEGRRQKITEMLSDSFNGELPDAVFSHGAGLKKNEKTGTYRTLSFGDLSEHGLATGSRTRVIAAAEIAKNLPDMKIVTSSFNRFDSEEPTMASIIKEELTRRGVSDENIILEEESFSTPTQIVAAIRMAVENGWTRVVNITNRYHLERMQGIYEHLETVIDDDEFQGVLKEFKDGGGKIGFICAEDVMGLISSRFRSYIEAVEQTPAFLAMVEAEKRGVTDLKAGKYRVVLHPENKRE